MLKALALFLGVAAIGFCQSNSQCPGATGTTPHCVVLGWGAPSSGSAPTTYNLYSGGTTPGQCANVTASTCTKVGSVAAPTLTFTLNTSATVTLTEGATYYYVVTAANASGESGPSNETSVKIPFLLPGSPANLTSTAH